MAHILILGGGAAGLAAALTAAQTDPTARVTVLERSPRPGKKLLATGARGALCAAASPAASPAAPPPRMRMFGILTPAFLSRISEAVLISRVLCL